jgi:superfamily II DNA or RNA helicase
MSRKLNLDNLTIEKRHKIIIDLCIEIPPTKYIKGPPKYIYPYEVDEYNNIFLPFSYNTNIDRPSREVLGKINSVFEGKLYEEQEDIKKECITNLNKTGSTLIAARTGFGKSALAINIAVSIKLKTLIIVNRVVLTTQWKESILSFSPKSKVQILGSKKVSIDDDVDFYIINAINIIKRKQEEYSKIGTIICDEIHLILADKLSKCMTYLCPRYMIGLSATPYRNDGLDVLFDLYFGKNKIVRKLYRKHDVYVVNTNIKPKVEKTIDGKINWNSIIDSLSTNIDRNKIILDLVNYFPSKVLLIVTKRVEQAEYLYQKLKENGESVDYLIGSKQEFDNKCRILIGTIQKVGVGFDFKQLDGLILAIDVESYFIQILGRIFRRRDNVPFVFDLVDDNPILKKHFETRKNIYLECGGTLTQYNKKLLLS